MLEQTNKQITHKWLIRKSYTYQPLYDVQRHKVPAVSVEKGNGKYRILDMWFNAPPYAEMWYNKALNYPFAIVIAIIVTSFFFFFWVFLSRRLLS